MERVKHLLLYHWGSVVGGSLIQGFFYFIDLTFDFFNVLVRQYSRATNLTSQ